MDCQELIDEYVEWLRRGLSVEQIGEACELTTPFLDRHNDHLQVYAQVQDGQIILSDDGYILSDLRSSGFELTTPKRKEVLEAVLNGFGVRIAGNQLVVEASRRTLGQKMHSLVQAMLTINDMFMMVQSRVTSFFLEDVREFLEQNDVRYSPHIKIAGRSGFDHAVHFLIPKSKRRPERLVQAINAPSKSTIGNVLFVVEDTRETRALQSEAYVFLNDRDREIGGDVVEALGAYKVTPALWSKREQYVAALAQ